MRGDPGDNTRRAMPQKEYLINSNEKHPYGFYMIPFEKGNIDSFLIESKIYSSQTNNK